VRAIADVDHHGGLAGFAHQLRGAADRRVGRAHDGRAANQRPDGPAPGVERAERRAAVACARPVEQRACDVAQPRRPGEQLLRDVVGDTQADRLLRGARRESGRQAREHRGVPEQLAWLQQLDDAPVEDQLDGAAAHDPQIAGRLVALSEDRRAGIVVLRIRRRGDALELVALERVERRVAG
jgi:hypothetical protein